jgi:subfamily B ATP-binding cassette protein HlyB/CyaB
MGMRPSTGDVAESDLTLEEALWITSSFCSVHHIPFDPGLFAQRFPPPIGPAAFLEAADELGFAAEYRHTSVGNALAWSLPLAVRLWPKVSAPAAHTDATPTWGFVLHASESQVVILEAGMTTPAPVTMADFAARYAGIALSLRPKAAESADPDALQMRTARFGLRWFVPELLKHRKVWHEVLLASLALQLVALAVPLFTQVIIDKVIVHRTESTLIALIAGLVIFLIFTGLLTWVRQYLVLHTGQRVDAVLGSHIFDHLFRLPPLYFQHRPTGVIAARLQGTETIREFIASAAVTLALDLPFLMIFVAIMFWYSVTLSLVVLSILLIIAALSAWVAPRFQAKLNQQFLRGAQVQAFVTEYVSGLETVKALQIEPQINQRYRNQLAEFLKSAFATRQLANTYNTWASSLEQLMSLMVLAIGAWIVMTSGSFTVGMLVAFQMFTARISQPVLRSVGLWQQWQQTRLAIARLGDIMNAPTESYSVTPRRTASGGASVIEIQGLSFRYGDRQPFLFQDFGLTVPAGQLVAIVGPSGAGKSTLGKLLLGFHAPYTGRIRLDGIDHNHLSANELRSLFGVVPQETVLFSGSVLENLKLANPYASFEQVVAACRMAEIHGAIEAMPDGYQTIVGERGVGLSGGQRQRLAIARALLKGPKVLLFDEATSSVDPITAEQLGRTITALKGRVTIVFIAHVLPKSLQVDQVVRIGEKLSVISNERVDPVMQP